MLGRVQFARQFALFLNERRAKHVETWVERHQDRGSTPLASTRKTLREDRERISDTALARPRLARHDARCILALKFNDEAEGEIGRQVPSGSIFTGAVNGQLVFVFA